MVAPSWLCLRRGRLQVALTRLCLCAGKATKTKQSTLAGFMGLAQAKNGAQKPAKAAPKPKPGASLLPCTFRSALRGWSAKCSRVQSSLCLLSPIQPSSCVQSSLCLLSPLQPSSCAQSSIHFVRQTTSRVYARCWSSTRCLRVRPLLLCCGAA